MVRYMKKLKNTELQRSINSRTVTWNVKLQVIPVTRCYYKFIKIISEVFRTSSSCIFQSRIAEEDCSGNSIHLADDGNVTANLI
jgi:hypothetical protein